MFSFRTNLAIFGLLINIGRVLTVHLDINEVNKSGNNHKSIIVEEITISTPSHMIQKHNIYYIEPITYSVGNKANSLSIMMFYYILFAFIVDL